MPRRSVAGAIRTDFILGTGPAAIIAGSGLNVITANNVANARFANGTLTVNGVNSTLTNITNLNLTNAGGVNTIDLAPFTGTTFLAINKPGQAFVRGGRAPTRSSARPGRTWSCRVPGGIW